MIIKIRNLIAGAALATLSLLANSTANAQSAMPGHAELNIENLKSAYLECERAALRGELATGDIMFCSIAYEDLKRHVFDGDFIRLKAWADEHLAKKSS